MKFCRTGHWDSLADALAEIESWERDAEEFGFDPESIQLSFSGVQWIVLVPEDLLCEMLF